MMSYMLACMYVRSSMYVFYASTFVHQKNIHMDDEYVRASASMVNVILDFLNVCISHLGSRDALMS